MQTSYVLRLQKSYDKRVWYDRYEIEIIFVWYRSETKLRRHLQYIILTSISTKYDVRMIKAKNRFDSFKSLVKSLRYLTYIRSNFKLLEYFERDGRGDIMIQYE